MSRKSAIILSLIVMILGWAFGGLFVANSIFHFEFMETFQLFIAGLGNWGWIIFSLIFCLLVGGLFFIGGIGSAFISMSCLLFPIWQAFIISSVCIFLCSILQYIIGDKIGEKPFKRVIGDTNYEVANKVIGSPTFVALALFLPYFPDSLVCFFAGTSKMKLSTFSIIALLTRTIGVAGICFLGSGILSISTWQPVFDAIGTIPALMIMFSTFSVFLAWVVGIFIGGKWLEKKIEQKRLNKKVKLLK